MSDLTAKARRAAEWWKLQDHLYPVSEHGGAWVCVTESGRLEWSDEQFISEAVTQGWQDQDQEADGVKWHVGSEWATVNGHTIAIECGQALFTWVVFQDGEQGVTARSNPVTPPHTREEARRQAVEAARGMG